MKSKSKKAISPQAMRKPDKNGNAGKLHKSLAGKLNGNEMSKADAMTLKAWQMLYERRDEFIK